ncbi:tyrosine recombinase XerC [Pseudomonas sp. Snoq117.2]|uniref:site-specific integrase n=1 Tax=Pseudomonas sp. Snoq117.2 TaxID=1500302 RepID=UPI0008B79439|nr:site-specific integrase [Pseudomonas sp. Snoq117.2]SEP37164.1 Site-specific recombinase XerD [Pseudomonas sp. Snoq117.2]
MNLPLFELTEKFIALSDFRPATEKIYRAAARAFIRRFEDLSLEQVDREKIIEWRKQLLDDGLSKRSWNTYSSHLKTIAEFGLNEGLVDLQRNPFKKTSVVPPKRRKKTVARSAIERARDLLLLLEQDELKEQKRAKITPAWFWLIVFETFHLTGIRLNALISIRLQDIDLEENLIVIRGELEKTHREFAVPIPTALYPHLTRLLDTAVSCGFEPADQLFNVNRFSSHYRRDVMNDNQVEAMYTKLIRMTGVRMTPHRFRHTLASDLMRQPDRNIHVTKQLLNHSNLATTMEYIEPDYEVMRDAMNDRIEAAKPKHRQRARVDYGAPAPAITKAPSHHSTPTLTGTREPAAESVQASPRALPAPNAGREQRSAVRLPERSETLIGPDLEEMAHQVRQLSQLLSSSGLDQLLLRSGHSMTTETRLQASPARISPVSRFEVRSKSG